MATQTVRYQQALKALRERTATAVGRQWASLPAYDRAQVPGFVGRVTPLVMAGQRQAVAVTNAHLGRALGGPVGLNVEHVTGAAVRGGVAPAEVYTRPFHTVWTALARGDGWEQAVAAGLSRLTSTADTDVALSARAAASEIMSNDPRVVGYRRVPEPNACPLCLTASTQRYRTEDLMPIHNRCGCTVEPIIGTRDPGQVIGRGEPIEVHQHGELGPVIGRAGEHFDDGPS